MSALMRARVMVSEALVPQSSISRRRTDTFVSKEGSVRTGKSLKVREVVVHDEDEIAIGSLAEGCPMAG
jgi:hypothetical protein